MSKYLLHIMCYIISCQSKYSQTILNRSFEWVEPDNDVDIPYWSLCDLEWKNTPDIFPGE